MVKVNSSPVCGGSRLDTLFELSVAVGSAMRRRHGK
jgi:hypothetical protein